MSTTVVMINILMNIENISRREDIDLSILKKQSMAPLVIWVLVEDTPYLVDVSLWS